jgi:hypothetical protein
LNGLLDSNVRNLIEDVSIHVVPPQLASEDVDRFYRVITEDR